MHIYEGNIKPTENGRFHCCILKINHDEPNHGVVKEYTAESAEEANIWVDDEISRLTTGYGMWGNIDSETIENEEGDTYEDHCKD